MKQSLLLLMLVLPLMLFAQTQLKHEKKSYQKDGKLYMNKQLPVYLWIGNETGQEAKKIRLISESCSKYANPFYWDTEGLNTVRTPSKVDPETRKVVLPQEDIVFEVYADGLAPQSKINIFDGPNYMKNNIWYWGVGTKLKLQSKDRVSGVDKSYLSTNGSAFTCFNEVMNLDEEKEYAFKFYAVDNVGNVEELKDKAVSIDLTAPVVSLNFEGTKYKNIVSPNAAIILKAKDNLSGVKAIKYKMNDKSYAVYSNKLPMSLFPTGENKLSYIAIDNVMNQNNENDPKLLENFIVDRNAPAVDYELLGDQYKGKYLYISTRTKVKLNAKDDLTPVKELKYSINSKDYLLYQDQFVMESRNGWQSVVYFASDMVNNVSVKRKASFYVDAKNPLTKITYSKPKFFAKDTLYINSKTKISLLPSDNASGVKKTMYQINGSAWTEGTRLQLEKEGFVNLSFKSVDNVNNEESQKASSFYVDNTPPIIYNKFSIDPIGYVQQDGKKIAVYPGYVNLYLSATDMSCGTRMITYQINGGTFRDYASENNPSSQEMFKAEKVYTVKVCAYDMLGNKSEKTIVFKIENDK